MGFDKNLLQKRLIVFSVQQIMFPQTNFDSVLTFTARYVSYFLASNLVIQTCLDELAKHKGWQFFLSHCRER